MTVGVRLVEGSSLAQTAPPARAGFKGRFRLAGATRRVIGLLVFLGALEFVTRLELVPRIYLPYASDVLWRMGELLVDPSFLRHLVSTVVTWLLALSVAALIGAPLGILLGLSETGFRAMSPIIEFMRPIPAVALIPLGIMLWGQGIGMKIILAAWASVWPILFNTLYGVHDIDQIAVETGRSYGLPQRAIIGRVILPSAGPFIFAGVRTSASIALIVVIGTELLASSDAGIGSFILFASANGGDAASVLAGSAIAGLLGVAANSVFNLIDNAFFRWRFARDGAD